MSTEIVPPPARVAESDRRTAACAVGAPVGGGIDRRAFLTSAPRQLFSGVKTLMHEVAAFARPASGGQERAVRRQVALLDVSRCLAWSGTDCQVCYLKCPKRDEAMMLEGARPIIVTSVCDGCGICVEVCRMVNDPGAIITIPLPDA